MSGPIEFQSYAVFEVGKMIKSTKMKHLWKFSVDDSPKELRALDSLVSSKFRVMYNDKTLYDSKASEDSKKFGIDLKTDDLKFRLVKISDRKFDLYVNNEKFKDNTKSQKSSTSDAKPQKKNDLFSEPAITSKVKKPEPKAEPVKEKPITTDQKKAYTDFMNRKDDFLNYDQKDDDSDDEIFNRDNEKSQFRIDASEFDFTESKNTSNATKNLATVASQSKDQSDPFDNPKVGFKIKKKDAPEISKNFDDFMNFDFGREKAASKAQEKVQKPAVKSTAPPAQKANDDLFDFDNKPTKNAKHEENNYENFDEFSPKKVKPEQPFKAKTKSNEDTDDPFAVFGGSGENKKGKSTTHSTSKDSEEALGGDFDDFLNVNASKKKKEADEPLF